MVNEYSIDGVICLFRLFGGNTSIYVPMRYKLNLRTIPYIIEYGLIVDIPFLRRVRGRVIGIEAVRVGA